MANGPGKYDDLCTEVRERSKADGAAVIILNGEKGNGFSIQFPDDEMRTFPEILEEIARQIREDCSPLH